MKTSSWVSRTGSNRLTPHTRSSSTHVFASDVYEAHCMDQQGVQNPLHSLVHECTHIRDIPTGRNLHCRTVYSCLNFIAIIGDHLVRMFAAHGSLFEASLAFCEVTKPSVYTWHAIISAHVMLEECHMALGLYQRMQLEGFNPGRVTFLCILKACGNTRAFWQGMWVHHQIMNCGLETDVVVGSTLIDMYTKCGILKEAHNVLDNTTNRNVVSYNAIITGCAQHGQGLLVFETFEKMQSESIKPNNVTYSSILKACGGIGAICQGKLVHNTVLKDGFHTDLVIVSSLIDMYVKCGRLEEARKVFDQSQVCNVVAWNAIIAGYVHHDRGITALALYQQMQERHVRPDSLTFSSVAKACGITKESGWGKYIHDQIIRAGLEKDLVVANMLIDMYAKCGSLDEALKVFDKLSARDIVSWGAIIAGYIQHGHGSLAIKAFKNMQLEGFTPSKSLFLSLLKACGTVGALEQAKHLHKQIIGSNIGIDVLIGSALIDMYAKCGNLEEAHTVFGEIEMPDVVSWNSLIAGYAQHGCSLPALELFQKMQLQGKEPDNTTFSCILKACGSIGAVELGKSIHHELVRSQILYDIILGNMLVDMYARCGALEDARKVLDGLPNQNVGSWGAMIAGYAQHGECLLAQHCFKEMQQQGIKPDEKAFTSILAACSHAGQVAEGHRYFRSMKTKYGIMPSLQHFNCMIDLLASTGRLKEAEKLLEEMPVQPDITGWMSLLAACRRYGDIARGRWCFDQVFRLDSCIAAPYVLISNIYADANMWDDIQKTMELRNRERAWKKPATAWIEVNNLMQEFVVGSKDHVQQVYIHEKVSRVKKLSAEQGYLPQLDLVFESALRKVDEVNLSSHSEIWPRDYDSKGAKLGAFCHEASNVVSINRVLLCDVNCVHNFEDEYVLYDCY